METPLERENGLKIVWDTIVMPNEAFERLRLYQTWGAAFLIAAILVVAGYFVERPAANHAAVGSLQHMFATSPMFANMTPAQKAKAIEQAQRPPSTAQMFGIVQLVAVLLIGCLLNALFLSVGNAIGTGEASFKMLWAGSMNIAVPTIGLASVILAIITVLRGPEAFSVASDLIKAIPNVGMIIHPEGWIGNALSSLNVFVFWGLFLNITLLRTTARIKGAVAWIVPLAITVAGAMFNGFFSGFTG